MTEKVMKSDAEWRAQLSDEEYRITRKHGTERAFTGPYHDAKDKGTYTWKPTIETRGKFTIDYEFTVNG